MGRGRAWSAVDDEKLCHAWVRVSEDPAKGTGQKAEAFWSRISEQFQNDSSDENQRNMRSITSRWGVIQPSVSKFCGIWARVTSSYASGVTVSMEEQIGCALHIYQRTHPKKLAFEFLRCWYVLRDAPKWIETCEKTCTRKAKTVAEEGSHSAAADSQVEDDVENLLSVMRRPVDSNVGSNKKAKPERSELQLLEMQENLANAAKEMAEATRKKVEILQDQVHMNLFTMRDDQIPEGSRRFFELKRARILQEMEEKHSQMTGVVPCTQAAQTEDTTLLSESATP